MASQVETATATAATIDLPRRIMASVRERPFFIDGTAKREGLLPEAPTAGEMFLASLAGCAAIIVNSEARRRAIPGFRAHFEATCGREAAVPNLFTFVHIEARIEGTSQAEAEDLVRVFQDQCPIYALAVAGTKVTINVKAAG
ncbi:MAG: OsmC family protein [Rhodobacteraceae bacterium]|nr:OsmC family protein [Paracoccaceae bacterium]